MDKEDKRLEKNSFELLLTLHEQLATNKNAQQGLFIKIFLALFGLFAAYGIVWSQAQGSPRLLNNCNFSFIVNDKILLFCGIVVIVALTYLALILIQFGWGFRHAQFVCNSIRKTKLSDSEYDEVFKRNCYGTSVSTLPDFYSVTLALTTALKILVSVSLNHAGVFGTNTCKASLLTILVFFIPCLFELLFYCKKKCFLMKCKFASEGQPKECCFMSDCLCFLFSFFALIAPIVILGVLFYVCQ